VNSYRTTYIGLGSNLDNPQRQIQSALNALAELPESRHLRCSDWYRSKAIGPGEQADYINAVVSLDTCLTPLVLLDQLQSIENHHGRQRHIRWGARTLDLDLLLYADICLNNDRLQLPHPEIMNRNFVLYPLNDLAPELIFPDGQTVKQQLTKIPMTDLVRITPHPDDPSEGNDCE
jgi:2-amino-4-hydroxy-6-hydroxymethyldihydropteridine diphosphokinase